jgi:hypothetical protein
MLFLKINKLLWNFISIQYFYPFFSNIKIKRRELYLCNPIINKMFRFEVETAIKYRNN